MGQLTLDQVARRADRLDDLGVRRRPSRSTLRATELTIRERFESFHAQHPEVYDLLVRLARKVKGRGKATYGMKALFEQARWFYHIEQGNEDFKLNNDFTALYARLIEAREPDLLDFFEKRRLRSE